MKILRRFIYLFVFLILISLLAYFAFFRTNIISLSTIIGDDNKKFILKYFLPYKFISNQNEIISIQKQRHAELEKQISNFESYLSLPLEIRKVSLNEMIPLLANYLLLNEMLFIESNEDFKIKKIEEIKLSNNKIMNKYHLYDGFYNTNSKPGGYIDTYEDNLFVLSSRGLLGYSNSLLNELNFSQINNNINEFINFNQFQKNHGFSLRDLYINNGKIFVSFIEEIKENCWNTSIIFGDIDLNNVKFRKLFKNNECIVNDKEDLIDKFEVSQSGGRIVNFDKNHILLTVGDYRSRYLAQDKNSINGKIIKINLNNFSHNIISMGHRNPQGLFFDKDNQIILETEHGPQGGDEINLIKLNEIKKGNILNFGWPIVSAGEHYGGKNESNAEKYKKYPLHKSHTEFGFVEPLNSFVPSIGISEITKIDKNKYVVSALKDSSIYFFELDNNFKLKNLERIEIGQRIRDIKFFNKKLYLFLEIPASIAVIMIE